MLYVDFVSFRITFLVLAVLVDSLGVYINLSLSIWIYLNSYEYIWTHMFIYIYKFIPKYMNSISSANWRSFIFSFLIWMPFISFSCLLVLAYTSSTYLNRYSESGQSCFVHDIKRKSFQVLTIKHDVSCELVIYGLYHNEFLSVFQGF